MKKIILFIIIAFIFVSSCTTIQSNNEFPEDISFESAEGSCLSNSDCVYAGEGCGGGHGVCTDNPEKYAGRITTCDIVPGHPINNGFSCQCMIEIGLCGWKK